MTSDQDERPRYRRGDRIGNRYQVHSFEQGGMGVVYFCMDLENNFPVALKTPIVKLEVDEKRRASLQRRFWREARTWAALGKHANIVQCHYLDTIDGQPFLVLEWIADPNRRHTSLYHLIKQGGMPLDQALDISLDIAYGMRYAGQAQPGLVHRDLKPGNVLVDQGMTAKISDFGLASVWVPEQGEVNRDMRVVGTPLYRPPEIWMRGPTDARSDIYACGLMLYEMLTGERAVQSADPVQLESLHIQGDTPHLPEEFPEEIDALIQRSTQRPPDERYQTFDELIATLSGAIRQHSGREPKAAPVAGDVTADDLVNRGNTFAWMERHKESLAAYNRALEMDGNSAAALQNRGALHMMMGHVQRALNDLNASIALNPRDYSAYYNRAVVLGASGNRQRALQDYNRTLSLKPSYVSAYYNRGILLRDLGQHEQALIDLTRVVNMTPTASDAFHNRGLTHLELSDYQSALDDFTRALELQPDQVASLYDRGVTHQLLGNVDEAIADYTAAIERKPDFRQAYEMRALLRHEKGELKEALDDYTRAILLGPDERVDLYYNRGLLLIEMGDHEAAITNLDYALAIDRHYLPAQLARAQAFLLNDQPEKARGIGEALMLLGFDSVPFHQHLYELFKAIGDEDLAAAAVKQGEALMASHAEVDLAVAFGGEGVSDGNAADRVAAFETFSQAATPEEVEALIERYPFMADSSFVGVAERILETREQSDPTITPRKSTANKARILWLRHYAHL